MQAVFDPLVGATHDFDADQYCASTLSPLGARWTDYLCERQQPTLMRWLHSADPAWPLFCGGPPRCGKVSQ
jgi:hypothetical protein